MSADAGGRLEAVLRRERAIVAASLAGVSALAWLALLHMAHHMDAAGVAPRPAMPMTSAWTAGELVLTVAMWAVMMVGMMLPSAAPMVLMFATISRKRLAAGTPAVSTGVFVGGYLAVWTAFSVVAGLGQWALQRLALVSAPSLVATPGVGGALLVLAGVYQVTPLKRACLARCQSALGFILGEWREGRRGAIVMGLRHGLVCVGCCWALMALLFVAGVMNLVWVAALTAFVLIEKLVPAGRVTSWASGVLLIAWGLRLLL